MKDDRDTFWNLLDKAINTGKFVKLTLSKPIEKNSELRNVYVKPVLLKSGVRFSFTFRYERRDEVKNFDQQQTIEKVNELLETTFLNVTFFTVEKDVNLIVRKDGNTKLLVKDVVAKREIDLQHDKQKQRLLDSHQPWWFLLGLTTREGVLLPSMQHKFKQISRYVEIINDLIRSSNSEGTIQIADMGAGKGYLTFALCELLQSKNNLKTIIKGVEIRPDLVLKSNEIVHKTGLKGLEFVEGSIADFQTTNLDILIALHACDTATDDAITLGIKSGAKLIVCAPCCHKQIRKAITPEKISNPIIQHGIFLEREAVMITDTIRALILEYFGYKTQIMEFIETEHTPKNVLLIGRKTENAVDKEVVKSQIEALKKMYGIANHYLEEVLRTEMTF
ncbi:MAG: SAM-dependent methyltransferase [Lentimicrobiaceae bacterium]|nr:SAM-dependent methyltransferase [Lentimicrobiaceae bacterium]